MLFPASTYHPATIIDRLPCLLYVIRSSQWHACRLSFRVSRLSRMRAYASGPRGPVFRAGEYSNFGNGERQHAGIDYSPKGYSAFLVISAICAAAKLILIHDAYFFTWAAR